MAQTETIDGAEFERLSPAEVEALLTKGEIILMDIREINEFTAARIPGAVLAPMSELDPERLPAESTARVVLQCRSGGRTRKVAEGLIARGWTKIAHLEGGIIAWAEAGLPLIQNEG